MGWSFCTYLNIYPLDSHDYLYKNDLRWHISKHIHTRALGIYGHMYIYICVCVCTYHVHIISIYLFIHPSIYLCVFFPSKSLSQHMAKALQESMTMSCSQNVGSCHLSPTGFNPKVPLPLKACLQNVGKYQVKIVQFAASIMIWLSQSLGWGS